VIAVIAMYLVPRRAYFSLERYIIHYWRTCRDGAPVCLHDHLKALFVPISFFFLQKTMAKFLTVPFLPLLKERLDMYKRLEKNLKSDLIIEQTTTK
jgi:hypothetical protein